MLFIAHQQGHAVNATADVVVANEYFMSRWLMRVLMVLVR